MSRKKGPEEPESQADRDLMWAVRFERASTEIERNRYEQEVIASRRKKLREQKLSEELIPTEKPKPTMTEQIWALVQEEYPKRIAKKTVDMLTPGMDNPTPYTTSGVGWGPFGPSSPEVVKLQGKILLRMYRTFSPEEKSQMFPTVLPYVIDMAKVARGLEAGLTRDGKPATDDSGEPLTGWILVTESTDAKDAKQVKETIQKQMGLDVEVLTFTEGLERGFVKKRVPRDETEEPVGPEHLERAPGPSQSPEAGRSNISEPVITRAHAAAAPPGQPTVQPEPQPGPEGPMSKDTIRHMTSEQLREYLDRADLTDVNRLLIVAELGVRGFSI